MCGKHRTHGQTVRKGNRTHSEAKGKEAQRAWNVIAPVRRPTFLLLFVDLQFIRNITLIGVEETHKFLGELRDDVSEGIKGAVRESERRIGVGIKGLLICASECDVGHGRSREKTARTWLWCRTVIKQRETPPSSCSAGPSQSCAHNPLDTGAYTQTPPSSL